jgi:plasmid stabilization system protein ParE
MILEYPLAIEWSAKAKTDLGNIKRYIIRHFSERVAEKAIAGIFAHVRPLSWNPELGSIDEDYLRYHARIYVFVSTKNKIYFSVRGDVMLIHRIWDARQNPAKFKL